MIGKYIDIILYVTGGITATPLLQFFIPKFFIQKFYKLPAPDDNALFFVRHWGLVVFSLGALLIYAASDPAIRRPVMLAAVIEKIPLSILILSNSNLRKGMTPIALFDIICSAIYLIYLGGEA